MRSKDTKQKGKCAINIDKKSVDFMHLSFNFSLKINKRNVFL